MLLQYYKMKGCNVQSRKEIEQICEYYQNGESCKTIANRLNRSSDYVWELLKREGVNTKRGILERIPEEDQVKICEMYQNRVPTQKILDQFPKIKSQNSIIKIVRSKNIPIRKRGNAPRISDERFFEAIDNEKKAYILGLLISDGAVVYPNRKNRNPVWTITLKREDAYILDEIKEAIGIIKKICYERNEAVLSVTSLRMVKDLEKHGVVPRKSFITHFPFEVDKDLWKHVIRGIFDGDGGISNQVCYFYGSHKILSEIQSILVKEIGIKPKKITTRVINGADSFAVSKKSEVVALHNYIYADATIWIKRKREKVEALPHVKCSIADANTVVTDYLKM